jgi:hypothetical protein
MVEPEPDPLLKRFGNSKFYDDTFKNINYYDVKEIFRILEITKNKSDERYEAARQEFLKVYGQHKGRWHSTNHIEDRYVEVTRLHVEANQEEYIAFMRIQPNGYRGERYVPAYMSLQFHLLVGRVLVTYRRRTRTITRGTHVHVAPRSMLSLKCLSADQAAVFVFRITIDKNRRSESASQSM